MLFSTNKILSIIVTLKTVEKVLRHLINVYDVWAAWYQKPFLFIIDESMTFSGYTNKP